MDDQGIIWVLSVCSVASVPSVIFTFVALLKKKQWIGRLRVLAAAPYFIHGIVSIHLFHGIRQDPELAYATNLLVSVGIKACVGILLPLWNFTVAWVVRSRLSKDPNASWLKKERKSSGYFYLWITDAAILASLTFSVVIAYRFLPPTFQGCWDSQSARSTRLFFRIKEATGDVDRTISCRRVLMVQITTILTMTIMFLQTLNLMHFMSLPGLFRLAVIYAIRAIRVISYLGRIRHRDRSLEDKDTPPDEKSKTLASLFRNNGVTACLASHLHHKDVINVSLTSKTMRKAVFASSEKGSNSERREVLAVNSCDVDKKGQCWACANVICQSCVVPTDNVKVPRTTKHLTDCYAICTGCYLLRGAGQPAPFFATLHPGNLALQRPSCSDSGRSNWYAQKLKTDGDSANAVPLCLHCSVLGADGATAIREGRETKSLRMGTALKRRIYCAKCARALPKDRKRWWVYDCGSAAEVKHSHECHWEGHTIRRSSLVHG